MLLVVNIALATLVRLMLLMEIMHHIVEEVATTITEIVEEEVQLDFKVVIDYVLTIGKQTALLDLVTSSMEFLPGTKHKTKETVMLSPPLIQQVTIRKWRNSLVLKARQQVSLFQQINKMSS